MGTVVLSSTSGRPVLNCRKYILHIYIPSVFPQNYLPFSHRAPCRSQGAMGDEQWSTISLGGFQAGPLRTANVYCRASIKSNAIIDPFGARV